MTDYDEKLNTILNQIEFPGENQETLSAYLGKSNFTERVMESIQAHSASRMNLFTWFVFSAFNLLLLVILGSSKFIQADFFVSYPGLSQFFFLFLGLTFFGGLAGLIFTRKNNNQNAMHTE